MAISKIILNGVIQMDVTGVTVEASNLLAPNTAVGADGQPVTGAMTEKVLTTKSITANGTYDAEDDNADGYSSVTVNVPSSGGASNLVTGTFKGTTTGAAMDINIPYTGSGYPIIVVIEPTEGFRGNTTFASAIQRYANAIFIASKGNAILAPVYDSSETDDSAYTVNIYKNSTTNATSYTSSGGSNVAFYKDIAAAASANNIVKMRTNKKMSVYIASNSYGFMANVEYTYRVIYSS